VLVAFTVGPNGKTLQEPNVDMQKRNCGATYSAPRHAWVTRKGNSAVGEGKTQETHFNQFHGFMVNGKRRKKGEEDETSAKVRGKNLCIHHQRLRGEVKLKKRKLEGGNGG